MFTHQNYYHLLFKNSTNQDKIVTYLVLFLITGFRETALTFLQRPVVVTGLKK